MKYWKSIASILVFAVTGVVTFSQTPQQTPPVSSTPTPATSSMPASAAALSPKEVAAQAANEACDKVIALYMKDDWTNLKTELASAEKVSGLMSKEKQADLNYIRMAYQLHCPAWWGFCKNPKPVTFKITIWGKNITATYEPDCDEVGVQIPVGIRRNKVKTKVSWDPTFVDSEDEFPKNRSHWIGFFKCSKAQFAEAVAWHELGHTYVTNALSANQVIRFCEEKPDIYSACQEFYADTTSLYHAGPAAHIVLLKLRLGDFMNPDLQTTKESHARGGAYGVGSLLMTKIMSEPEKWPSFHFPPTLPDKNQDQAILEYMYRTLKGMTLAEDKAMREYLHKFMVTSGQYLLTSEGTILLPNNLKYHVMPENDQEFKAARTKWVVDQHKKIVDAGRADKEMAPPLTRPKIAKPAEASE